MSKEAQAVKNINIPFPLDLHSRLVALAERDGRSFRQEVLWLLRWAAKKEWLENPPQGEQESTGGL